MEKKKVNFKNSKGLRLAGVLHIPEEKTNSVIIFAHGFTSGKDRPRMIKLAEKMVENGFAVFRFDFGGHGESEDRIITVKDQVDDYNSAIEFVIGEGYTNVGLFGSSFGGMCSILVYSTKVSAIVLWAPNTKPYFSPLYNEQAKKEIEKQGFVNFEKPDRKFKIGEGYFTDVSKVNQKELLSNVKIPVLIMHGDEDDVLSFQDSREAMKYLPEGSKLEIMKGAGHNLESSLERIINLSVKWFKRYLN
jgi:alpha-beta hydrolase superfamily lysophospholipase